MGNKDTSSLAHTTYECKYHIVFTPKYRRQVIYGKIRSDIGVILRQLCEYKGVEIIEAEACKDHIHIGLYFDGYIWWTYVTRFSQWFSEKI